MRRAHVVTPVPYFAKLHNAAIDQKQAHHLNPFRPTAKPKQSFSSAQARTVRVGIKENLGEAIFYKYNIYITYLHSYIDVWLLNFLGKRVKTK